MIIEFLIDIFLQLTSPVLDLLNLPAFSVPETVYVFLTDIIAYVNFFLPMNQLQPLIIFVFTYYTARILMHIVRFVINLCHLGIE